MYGKTDIELLKEYFHQLYLWRHHGFAEGPAYWAEMGAAREAENAFNEVRAQLAERGYTFGDVADYVFNPDGTEFDHKLLLKEN